MDKATRQLLQETHDDVQLIKERQAQIKETIEKHDKVLYGNGRGGLITGFAVMRREAGLIGAGIAVVLTATVNWIFRLGSK